MLEKIIKERILIFDGAMGTRIAEIIDSADYNGYANLNEYLNLTRPDIIEKIHLEYLSAGADIIETNTFGANSIVLSEYGLENKVKEINLAAIKIAKNAISKFKREDKFIAGSIGPTNISAFLDKKEDFDTLKKAYNEQILALVEGGVDILIFETAHDIINLKAGLIAAFEIIQKVKNKIYVIASITMDNKDLMLSGHNILSAYAAIEHFPLFAFGINCSTGPKAMEKRIIKLNEISRFPVFIMPNAGLPDENGKYNETPEEFSQTIKDFAQRGLVNITGGCCGTNAKHIKALVEKIKGIKPRKIKNDNLWCISHIDTFILDKNNTPLLIGERNNSIGSKKFREVIAQENWNEAISIAQNQIKAGAKALDICLANPERNEIEDAKIFFPMLSKSVKIPFVIDTTNLEVAELALKSTCGKAIINSVNFESGEEKPLKAIEINKKYGAKIVFGLLDENKEKGLPVKFERKIEIAKRAYNFMIKNGLNENDLIFDALVFPVGVGQDFRLSAYETIKAVKKIKELFPNTKTILGISNISFGLPPKAREVLNTVFLREAILNGLDMAIINIEKNLEYYSISEIEKELAKDLIYARRENIEKEFADYYRKQEIKTIKTIIKKSIEDEIYNNILNGNKSKIKETLNELLKIKTPLEIINDIVLKAMSEIGKLFGEGKLIVTEVLMSAEVTKAIISELEPLLKKEKSSKRGKMMLATVKGDVHDIGKNLAAIIFESNGFEVIDLGVKVPPEIIIKKVQELKPDFIGLSGLLVKSLEEMKITAIELKKANIKIPLILGGAVLTEKYISNNIIPEYKGKVIYAKDVMSGLNMVLGNNINLQNSITSSEETYQELKKTEKIIFNQNTEFYPIEIPKPPFWERKKIENFDIKILFENIDWNMFNFKFLRAGPLNREKLKDSEKIINEFKNEIIEKKLLKANAIYQFFYANSKDNSLFIYDKKSNLLEEFIFPRQNKGKFLSIPDFISPLSSGKFDSIVFMALSCGIGVKQISEEFKNKGEYLKSYLIESLALSLTESLAETLHQIIRKEWGIKDNSGNRYSFGYPACPDLSNQVKLFKLIKAEDIGIKLTENFMMEPEASISAFIIHNPKAIYFSV